VGLVVFVGCGIFVITPEPEPVPRPGLRIVSPELTSTSSSSLPMVVIDAGHGGLDEGCRGHGLMEKDLTLDLAARVEGVLQSFNVPTILTRRDDHYVSLADRAAIANSFDHAIFVSIHFNQSRAGADGIETYFADQKLPPEYAWTWVGVFGVPSTPASDTGEKLAGYIHAALITKMEAHNRGIKSRNLYVVRHVHNPAVLVEAGFVSNPFEAQLLRNIEYRDRLASGIADGVLAYLKSEAPLKPSPEIAEIED
jgi:N-acetylmuramoyl-L-alanine amidase